MVTEALQGLWSYGGLDWDHHRLSLITETSFGLAGGNAVWVIGTRQRLDRSGGERLGSIRRELSWIVRHRLGWINRRVVVGIWTWLRHVDSLTGTGTGLPSSRDTPRHVSRSLERRRLPFSHMSER
jgi:hypothetical protein